MPPKHRLKEDKDFSRLFKKGRSFHGAELSIRVVPNRLDVSRFGFVVGVKTANKAVARNRLNRQLREIVRARLPDLAPGRDVAVQVKPGAVDLSFGELKKALVKLLDRASLLSS